MIKNYTKTLYLLIIATLLSGCGFHLRGDLADGNAGNFSSLIDTKFYIYNAGGAPPSLITELRRRLIGYGATVIKSKSQEEYADYIINIQSATKNTQMTSVVGGASNNTFLAIYTITYNVVKPKVKTPVVPDSTVNAQMFWQSNSSTQLAQNNELQRIWSYLQSDLMTRIVLQIAELLPSKETK
ncbi:LPS assembly lipoprotein LptE [Francisella salimarina]|uniref:LPS-assembly lipoprotein LptE n=1 Tax=Francisella salimarina TaxID=2599927 RepID=UPI003D812C6D